jgi:phosphoribosyl-ATP pyrophosphohydrolase
MSMGERTEHVEPEPIGPVLEQLAGVIHKRALELPEGSYTALLLQSPEDKPLKKVGEEALEVVMAAKDADHDHLRYEVADLVYHTMVVCERYGVGLEELAGELRARMH